HHPNLYSFPTRRSSDLNNLLLLRYDGSSYMPVIAKRGALSLTKEIWDNVSSSIFDITSDLNNIEEYDLDVRHKVLKEIGAELFGDRKSTRLNSSHVSIS